MTHTKMICLKMTLEYYELLMSKISDTENVSAVLRKAIMIGLEQIEKSGK
jgi:tRNA G18 (ribose-2'-O)-methylase SpoU